MTKTYIKDAIRVQMIFMSWLARKFGTFESLVANVGQLCSLSAHAAMMPVHRFLSEYLFTGVNKCCVICPLLSLTKVV